MSDTLLSVEKRKDLSKHRTKEIRRSGRVPAIFYIHGEEPIAVSIDAKELRGTLQSDHSIVDLSFNGKETVKSVIREIQWHPVTGKPLHVDFMGVKMTEKVTVDLPVYLVGTSAGVKNSGGILQQQLREISIECLPADIPEHFEIDVTNLELGQSIHVVSLDIDKVNILTDPDQVIVTVSIPRVVLEAEEVEELEEAEAAEDAEESSSEEEAAD